MKWIRAAQKSPEEGQLVVAWLGQRKEPVCVRFEMTGEGPLYVELVEVDRHYVREDRVTHWIPLPNPP